MAPQPKCPPHALIWNLPGSISIYLNCYIETKKTISELTSVQERLFTFFDTLKLWCAVLYFFLWEGNSWSVRKCNSKSYEPDLGFWPCKNHVWSISSSLFWLLVLSLFYSTPPPLLQSYRSGPIRRFPFFFFSGRLAWLMVHYRSHFCLCTYYTSQLLLPLQTCL